MKVHRVEHKSCCLIFFFSLVVYKNFTLVASVWNHKIHIVKRVNPDMWGTISRILYPLHTKLCLEYRVLVHIYLMFTMELYHNCDNLRLVSFVLYVKGCKFVSSVNNYYEYIIYIINIMRILICVMATCVWIIRDGSFCTTATQAPTQLYCNPLYNFLQPTCNATYHSKYLEQEETRRQITIVIIYIYIYI